MPEPSTLPPPPEGDPWDRQPRETAESFEAWVVYRDLGRDRSTAKVADELGKSKNICDRWSSRNAWVERAARWDKHLDGQRTRGVGQAAVVSGAEWERRRQRLMLCDYRTSMKLYRKARKLIATQATKSGHRDEVLTLGDLRNLTSIVKDAASIAKDASAVAWGVVNVALADVQEDASKSHSGKEGDASVTDS